MTTYVCPLLVGRDAERAALVSAATQRRTVLVSGPAGVGKSALVRNALDGRPFVGGRATPSSTMRPYRPLVDAVLRGRRAGREALPPVLVLLTEPAPAELDPLHLADALAAWLGDAVLVLEDLHWADVGTLDVVEQLASSGGTAVLATARDELPAIRGVDVVRLRPLPDDVVHEIASRCLGGALTARLAAAIARGAEGMPFLVEELLAALSTDGRLQSTPDGWDVVGGDPAVPRSIADTVVPRLARLDGHDRRVLAAAAVMGRRFDWQIAAAAADSGAEAGLAALRRAADLQLLDNDPDRLGALRFRHALTCDAVDALTFPPDRAALASKALDAMLEREPHPTGDDLLTAAELARACGRADSAAPLLIAAGTEAFDRHALDAAEQLLTDAAALSEPRTPVHLRALHERLRVLSGMGRLHDVEELGRRLLQELPADDSASVIEVRLRLARGANERRDPAAAIDHLDAARPLLGTGRSQACHPARVDLEEALAHVTAGRVDDAVDAAQRSIAQTFPDDPQRSQDDFADVEALALVAWARAVRRTDPDLARTLLDRAERVMDWSMRPLMLARIDVERAALDLDAGNTTPPQLARAERCARLAGGRSLVARIAILRGTAALLRLDTDGVAAHAAAAEQLAEHHALPVVARDAARLRAALVAVRGIDATEEVAALAVLARGGAAVLPDIDLDCDVLSPFTALADGRPTAAPWIHHQRTRLHSDDRDALADAAVWFEENGLSGAAEATRDRLRALGIPFPRRRSALAVPELLQARGITVREHEVLQLVAQGLSNREVAAELVLSVRTVDKHVEHLLAKTGCANRTALAHFAAPAST